MKFPLIIASHLLACVGLCGQIPEIDFVWEGDQAVGVQFFWSTGLVSSNLQVTRQGSKQAIFGNWKKVEGQHIFYPAIPFAHGIKYQLNAYGQPLKEFELPPLRKAAARVVHIYPTTDTVPENLLKIHIQFSEAMGERYSEDYLIVTKSNGDTLQDIFLPLQPELWNESRDRLTLWLDPGRIKRGLLRQQEFGKPLHADETYLISVEKGWKDVYGRPLIKSFNRILHVKAPDRVRPDPKKWRIRLPSVHSSDPLIVQFGETLDAVLGHECLSILDGSVPVDGHGILDEKETRWIFYPSKTWRKGSYQLLIEARLEDLAGNNLDRLFDRKVEKITKKEEVISLIAFEIE